MSRYQEMEPLPAVTRNLQRLKTLLTEPDLWGLSARHCTLLANPRSTETVLDAVHAAAAEAEDALLVYFAGHGLVSLKGDLYLALPSSHAERIYSGVSYDLLRSQLVDEATALSRIVILDCCYGGRALDGYMGLGAGAGRTIRSAGSVDVADSVAVEGTYVMTAAAGTKQALAPPGEKYTAFTGELIRALEKGVPDGPDPLSMDALFHHVRRELAAKDRPRPQQRARNGGTGIALVRNRWAVAEARRPADEARRPAEEAQRAAEGARQAAGEETSEQATDVQARSLLTAPEPVPGRNQQVRPKRNAARPLRLRRPGRVLLALSLVAGLLGGGTYLYLSRTQECDSKGVTKMDGDCVGVTDGSYAFTAGLRDVTARIGYENKEILDSGAPSVAIALMTSMTTPGSEEQQRIRHKLEGAYLAQLFVNHNQGPSGTPKIRILLANPGSEGTHWEKAATQLEDLAMGRSPLRAVIGLDSATGTTRNAISYLATHGIPVVSSSTAPATESTGDSAPAGVAWVMAGLVDQQRALTRQISDLDPQRSVLVSDEDPSNLYATTLRQGFQQIAKKSPFPPQSYPAPWQDSAEVIAGIADKVCQIPKIETVLFAGSAEPLRIFLNSLAQSLSCAKHAVTVISGPDTSRLPTDQQLDWERLQGPNNIRLRYVTAFHPDAWRTSSAPKTGGSRAPLGTLLKTAKLTFGPLNDNDLADGTLVATYDAGLTAVAAVRQSLQAGPTLPSLAAVAQALPYLNGQYKVQGASGWICLDRHGHPFDKAVAVAQLDFKSRQPELVTVAWPEGKPPPESCAPNGSSR